MTSEPETTDTAYLATLISQLEDLVKIALAAEKNEVSVSVSSFVDVHKKLMAIYHMIEQYRRQYAQALATLGLTPKDIKLTPEDMEKLGVRERKLLEKLSSLQSVCEQAKERVHQTLLQNQPVVENMKDELKNPDRKSARRKSKFKNVGGKKGWLPS